MEVLILKIVIGLKFGQFGRKAHKPERSFLCVTAERSTLCVTSKRSFSCVAAERTFSWVAVRRPTERFVDMEVSRKERFEM